MSEGRAFPIAGITIALATGAVLLGAGVRPWLVALALVVWLGTLWLPVPARPPQQTPAEPDAMQLTLAGMGELIEHSGLPVLILDRERIVLANAMAREVFGGHILTQDPRVAFRHP